MYQEGIIKYTLDFNKAAPPDKRQINRINAWRKILYQLKLVGQDDNLYNGAGYGNLSCRLNNSDAFIITASQTGHLPDLEASHYSTVTQCNLATNGLSAMGMLKPSSEALTHAAVYQSLPAVQFVFHAHSPLIWRNVEKLHIPATAPEIHYGTIEMAKAIARLCEQESVRIGRIMAMGGHEDGIIAFGQSAPAAGLVLVEYLVAGIEIAISG